MLCYWQTNFSVMGGSQVRKHLGSADDARSHQLGHCFLKLWVSHHGCLCSWWVLLHLPQEHIYLGVMKNVLNFWISHCMPDLLFINLATSVCLSNLIQDTFPTFQTFFIRSILFQAIVIGLQSFVVLLHVKVSSTFS